MKPSSSAKTIAGITLDTWIAVPSYSTGPTWSASALTRSIALQTGDGYYRATGELCPGRISLAVAVNPIVGQITQTVRTHFLMRVCGKWVSLGIPGDWITPSSPRRPGDGTST